jgi:hypothetical protein
MNKLKEKRKSSDSNTYPGCEKAGPKNNEECIGRKYFCILIFCNLLVYRSKKLDKRRVGNHIPKVMSVTK